MAIGLGHFFGFTLPENFNYPFISKSITEFWRRWHISLSTWFKEYVYIPLGGNRKGYSRQILNIAIVWLLTGLWHGASWNFVMWGGYFAILLILEKTILLRPLKKLPAFLQHAYAMLAVVLSFAIFYFEDISSLGSFLVRLFTPASSQNAMPLILGFLPLTIAAVIASTPAVKNLFSKNQDAPWVRYGKIAVCALGMLLCVAALVSQSYNPFIYFRF